MISKKVPISTRAAFTRINRHLTDVTLKKTKGLKARHTLGEYYLVKGKYVIGDHINLETFARHLGVLHDYERVE